jgi:hypothetical protein
MKLIAIPLAASGLMFAGAASADPPAKAPDSAACAPDRPCPAPSAADYHALRLLAEDELRTMLIDPSSAQFEWPLGFAYGSWRPTVYGHMTGYLGCGTLNSKNRYGGYAGVKWFTVIIRDDDKKVLLAHIDQAGGFPQAKTYCGQVALPPPQAGMLDAAAAPGQGADQTFSVADELAKLAALRDKGILTQTEFEAQKAALLKRYGAP